MNRMLRIRISALLLIALLAIVPTPTDAVSALDMLTAEQLTNESPAVITRSLKLPESYGGETLSWSSNNAAAIDNGGAVTRDIYEERTATLTASTAGGDSKAFVFTVAPMTTNLIYQDNFYYPDWLKQDFLTTSTGGTLGWTRLWNGADTHRIQALTDAAGNVNYVLEKDGNITERTVYTLPASPDTLTLSLDAFYDIEQTDAAIYDYFLYFGDASMRLRYNFRAAASENSTGGVELRLTNLSGTAIYAGTDATLNLRQQWHTLTFRLNQMENTLSLLLNGDTLASNISYGSPEVPLSKLYLQPGSQATCKPLYVDNFFLAEYKSAETYKDEVAVEATLSQLDTDLFTTQSPHAITKTMNLNPPALKSLNTANGTTVSFTSSHPTLLSVENNTATPHPADTETQVILTAAVSSGQVTKTRDFTLSIPAKGDYLFVSEGFGYPDMTGEYVASLDNWTGVTHENGFYCKLAEENGSCFIDARRDTQSSGNQWHYYDFTGLRRTDTLAVEMTLTYKETAYNAGTDGTLRYDFDFYGRDVNGNLDTASSIVRVQVSTTTIGGYARAEVNGSNRLRIEFDFENQGYNLYLDGTKQNTDLLPFRSTATTCVSLGQLRLDIIRQGQNGAYRLDDFVVKAHNPAFANSYWADTVKRPLNCAITDYTTGGNTYPQIAATSSYDSENLLEQRFVLLNQGVEYKNEHYDYNGAYLIHKSSGTRTALQQSDTKDESAPVSFNGLYLGANHGAHGVVVTTAEAHGKTYNDVGSRWQDANGQKWCLLRILSDTQLHFLSENLGTSDTEFQFTTTMAAGVLTCVDTDYAENTGDIAIGSINGDNQQLYPSIARLVQKLYIVCDGTKTEITPAAGVNLDCDRVILEESYDIMNPATVGAALRSTRPAEGGWTEEPAINIGQPIAHYTQTITATADGTVFVGFEVTIAESIGSIEYYGYQYYPKADAFGGGVYRYLPGTKAFTVGTSEYDFSVPYPMTSNFPSKRLTAESWADASHVPDRIVDYMMDSEGQSKMAFVSGYVPVLDAEPAARLENTSESIFIYDSKKAYPVFVNDERFTQKGTVIRGVAYRKYEDLSTADTGAEVYTVCYGDDIYYYIDLLSATQSTLDLSAEYAVYQPEIVYKSVGAACSLFGSRARISGSAGDYVLIKATRGMELNGSVYDAQSEKATVRVENHTATDDTAVIFAAAYQDGRLMTRSAPTPVAQEAGGTLLQEVDIAADAADTLKFFLWKDVESLTPLGKISVLGN